MFSRKSNRALALLIGLCVGFGLFPYSAGAETNLIQNGGLETGSSYPSGWSRVYWGSPIPTFSYPVTGRTGRAAAVSYSKVSTGDARWQHTAVSVEPGASYTYTNWYSSNAPSEINIEYQNSRGGKSYAWVATLPSSAGAWTQASVTFTVPSGIAKASVYHLLDQQGVLTIDDVALVKNGTTPPPPPSPTPTTTPSGWNEGMVTLSFDDAWSSQHANALPVLTDAGLKGTFYVLTQPVQNGWSTYMTPAQVKDIAAKGHDIQGHTVTHRDLTTLSQASIDAEIKNSKAYIENLTGKTVTSLAYPYGSNSTKVVDRVKLAGYTNARTADPTIPYGFNTPATSRYVINSFSPTNTTTLIEVKAAIDKARAEKLWFVFSVHQVKLNGTQYDITPAMFADIVAYIKSSGIKVVTMAEGAALLKD